MNVMACRNFPPFAFFVGAYSGKPSSGIIFTLTNAFQSKRLVPARKAPWLIIESRWRLNFWSLNLNYGSCPAAARLILKASRPDCLPLISRARFGSRQLLASPQNSLAPDASRLEFDFVQQRRVNVKPPGCLAIGCIEGPDGDLRQLRLGLRLGLRCFLMCITLFQSLSEATDARKYGRIHG